jgi:hypothetical protein
MAGFTTFSAVAPAAIKPLATPATAAPAPMAPVAQAPIVVQGTAQMAAKAGVQAPAQVPAPAASPLPQRAAPQAPSNVPSTTWPSESLPMRSTAAPAMIGVSITASPTASQPSIGGGLVVRPMAPAAVSPAPVAPKPVVPVAPVMAPVTPKPLVLPGTAQMANSAMVPQAAPLAPKPLPMVPTTPAIQPKVSTMATIPSFSAPKSTTVVPGMTAAMAAKSPTVVAAIAPMVPVAVKPLTPVTPTLVKPTTPALVMKVPPGSSSEYAKVAPVGPSVMTPPKLPPKVVTCPSGQKLDVWGKCVAAAIGGGAKSCPVGQTLVFGTCVANAVTGGPPPQDEKAQCEAKGWTWLNTKGFAQCVQPITSSPPSDQTPEQTCKMTPGGRWENGTCVLPGSAKMNNDTPIPSISPEQQACEARGGSLIYSKDYNGCNLDAPRDCPSGSMWDGSGCRRDEGGRIKSDPVTDVKNVLTGAKDWTNVTARIDAMCECVDQASCSFLSQTLKQAQDTNYDIEKFVSELTAYAEQNPCVAEALDKVEKQENTKKYIIWGGLGLLLAGGLYMAFRSTK